MPVDNKALREAFPFMPAKDDVPPEGEIDAAIAEKAKEVDKKMGDKPKADPRILRLLEQMGPPSYWSNEDRRMLGKENVEAMEAAWAAMSPEEQAAIEAKFDSPMPMGAVAAMK